MVVAVLAAAVAAVLAGCGAGRWGYDRSYVPLKEERPFHEGGSELAYSEVTTDPADYRDRLVAWFGMVESVEPAEGGKHTVRMSHHKHQDRHLCKTDSKRSCRVTVHFKSSGGFSAVLDLRPEDMEASLDKVQPGSLLRVFGKVRCREDEDEQVVCDYDDQGGVILEGEHYRQWPARYYVTTRAASIMRR